MRDLEQSTDFREPMDVQRTDNGDNGDNGDEITVITDDNSEKRSPFTPKTRINTHKNKR